MFDAKAARRVMVDNQIRTFDVTDRAVVAAFEAVPRERFVAEQDRALAYLDRAVTVSAGEARRSLLPPLILARLIQALAPVAGERALDVCGGSGYSAAVLAACGLTVSAIETAPEFEALSRDALAAVGTGVEVLKADPALGAGAAAGLVGRQFDLILVNGASEVEPTALLELLAEGGRLGIIRNEGGSSQARVYLRVNGVTGHRRAFDSQAPVLAGFARPAGFAF